MSMVRLAMVLLCTLGATAPVARATNLQDQPEIRGGLRCGDPAPTLRVSEWVKGADADGVAGALDKGSYARGRVYVVEFWATWCGPCIAAMPHLSELAQEYPNDVTVVGLTTLDRHQDAPKVRAFVESRPDRMRYPVAIDDGTASFTAFMRAAGRDGIPCTFVIDRTGKVAFIGGPDQLGPALDAIVAGTWNIERDAKRESDIELEYRRLTGLAIDNPADAIREIEAFQTAHDATPGARVLIEKLDLPRYDSMVRTQDARAAMVGRNLLYRARARQDADLAYWLARGSIHGVFTTTAPPPEIVEIAYDAVRDVLFWSEQPEAETWLREERGTAYALLADACAALGWSERAIDARRRSLELASESDRTVRREQLSEAEARHAQSQAATEINDEIADEAWARLRDLQRASEQVVTAQEQATLRASIESFRAVHPSFGPRLGTVRLQLEVSASDPLAATTLRELAIGADALQLRDLLRVCITRKELTEVAGLAAACVDAAQDMARAMERDPALRPNLFAAHAMLAVSLRAAGRNDESERERARALELAPESEHERLRSFIENPTGMR